MRMLFAALVLVLLAAAPSMVQKQERKSDGERITIEDLKRKMDRKEDLLIIDARAGSSWIGSSVKIKGAVHITLDEIDARIDDLPKEREIVVYCT